MNINISFINLFARATERAAYGASLFKGQNDKMSADKAAVDEMRKLLNTIDMKGKIVIGEGEVLVEISIDKLNFLPIFMVIEQHHFSRYRQVGL